MSDSLLTPLDLVDALHESYGMPALDPCSCFGSVVCARTELFLSRGQDGLVADWREHCGSGGWAFINPPYSNVGPWLEKSRAHADLRCVYLLKYDPTASWYHRHVRLRADVGVFRKRLRFTRTDGGKQYAAQFVSCLVLYNISRPSALRSSLDWIER